MRGETSAAFSPLPPGSNFNPLAPCGARPSATGGTISLGVFQSTRPVRGETNQRRRKMATGIIFQSSRPARDETPEIDGRTDPARHFNPLARTGRDVEARCLAWLAGEFQSTRPARGETSPRTPSRCFPTSFQSTRPARGETNKYIYKDGRILISIHSPRTGRDLEGADRGFVNGDISIHSPRTGRDACVTKATQSRANFNPLAPHGARLIPASEEG